MKIVILFALFATACAVLPERHGTISYGPGERESFIAVLDLIRSLTLIAELNADHLESEERDRNAVISVIDKIKAVANAGDWDVLNLEEGEGAAFLAVENIIKDVGTALEEAGGNLQRATRSVDR